MCITFNHNQWGHLRFHPQIHIGVGVPRHWTPVVWMGLHILCCPHNITNIQTLNTKSPRWQYIFAKLSDIKTLRTILKLRPSCHLKPKVTAPASYPTNFVFDAFDAPFQTLVEQFILCTQSMHNNLIYVWATHWRFCNYITYGLHGQG
jgi:hypothetical protein